MVWRNVRYRNNEASAMQNGGTDRAAVWDGEWGAPKDSRIRCKSTLAPLDKYG